jgi:hypothetical protein
MFSVDWKVFQLTRKCFPLTNFSNGKQTQESLESGFPKNEFQKTNIAWNLKEKNEEKNKKRMNIDVSTASESPATCQHHFW